MSKLLDLIRKDEGTGPIKNGRMMPYKDSEGVLTIGYGIAIGITGLSFEEADMLLLNRVNETIAECKRTFAWYQGLDGIRKNVIISMVYNMGLTRFKTFKKTIALIEARKYTAAGDEMLDSKWAKQVKSRANRLSTMMKEGGHTCWN